MSGRCLMGWAAPHSSGAEGAPLQSCPRRWGEAVSPASALRAAWG
eukprot:CAMPEP_0177594190 /NCGR_PEP_ID=MMETSP0419_2-20121207/9639_1 /TAXON_ID=582737 /ORGANISM="Tetraselmis sp., Strain GSL018" /LENGTH=44 /DNA_ID= /DNA_START= /DNA_END= /DNA_ORIENTATION=